MKKFPITQSQDKGPGLKVRQDASFNWVKQLTINQSGGVWAGLFTLVMLGKLVDVCFLTGTDFTSGSLSVYGIVIGAFATSKTISKFVNGKNGNTVSED